MRRTERPEAAELARSSARAAPLASIVPVAAAILREELPSLASATAAWAPHMVKSETPAETGRAYAAAQALIEALPLQEMLRSQDPRRANQVLPVLLATQPVDTGGLAQVSLRVRNDDTEADHCRLYATDLLGPAGRAIPAAHVLVTLHPAVIPAGETAEARIEIRVPSGLPHGRYTGLLQTDDGESLRALIQIAVGAETSGAA